MEAARLLLAFCSFDEGQQDTLDRASATPCLGFQQYSVLMPPPPPPPRPRRARNFFAIERTRRPSTSPAAPEPSSDSARPRAMTAKDDPVTGGDGGCGSGSGYAEACGEQRSASYKGWELWSNEESMPPMPANRKSSWVSKPSPRGGGGDGDGGGGEGGGGEGGGGEVVGGDGGGDGGGGGGDLGGFSSLVIVPTGPEEGEGDAADDAVPAATADGAASSAGPDGDERGASDDGGDGDPAEATGAEDAKPAEVEPAEMKPAEVKPAEAGAAAGSAEAAAAPRAEEVEVPEPAAAPATSRDGEFDDDEDDEDDEDDDEDEEEDNDSAAWEVSAARGSPGAGGYVYPVN